MVKRRIPDRSTETYPTTKTENRLGTQRSWSRLFCYITTVSNIQFLPRSVMNNEPYLTPTTHNTFPMIHTTIWILDTQLLSIQRFPEVGCRNCITTVFNVQFLPRSVMNNDCCQIVKTGSGDWATRFVKVRQQIVRHVQPRQRKCHVCVDLCPRIGAPSKTFDV